MVWNEHCHQSELRADADGFVWNIYCELSRSETLKTPDHAAHMQKNNYATLHCKTHCAYLIKSQPLQFDNLTKIDNHDFCFISINRASQVQMKRMQGSQDTFSKIESLFANTNQEFCLSAPRSPEGPDCHRRR